jgi:EpsI family protein
VHLTHYQKQEQGVELINANNHMVDGVGWQIEPASEGVISAAGDLSIKAATVAARAKKERVWYWYDVSGYTTSNEYVAKIYQILAFLRGRSDATLVAISTNCSGNCESQDALLHEFFTAMPSASFTSSSHSK